MKSLKDNEICHVDTKTAMMRWTKQRSSMLRMAFVISMCGDAKALNAVGKEYGFDRGEMHDFGEAEKHLEVEAFK